jgi:hypothetical protein
VCYFGDLNLKAILENNGEKKYRGRPLGRNSKSNKNVLKSIAHIAAKYELDSKLLLDAFNRAWINEEFRYGELYIKSRKVDQSTVTFQVTLKNEVIWQFPIDRNILENPELYRSSIPVIPIPLHRKNESGQKNISELRDKMKHITVNARVVEIPPKRLVNTRYGFESFVSNVLLADKTGAIRIGLWNNQIDDVVVGDTVNIDNASVSIFRGKRQLRIGRKGTMNIDTSTRNQPLTKIRSVD